MADAEKKLLDALGIPGYPTNPVCIHCGKPARFECGFCRKHVCADKHPDCTSYDAEYGRQP